jgi:hypothetical protein
MPPTRFFPTLLLMSACAVGPLALAIEASDYDDLARALVPWPRPQFE